MHYFKILLITIAAAFLLASCSETSTTPNGKVKIGAIFNLTGSQSSLDSKSYQGAKLAVNILNSTGGINGKAIELICRDGKTNTDTIKQLTQKLIDEDGVCSIIGFSDSDMLEAALEISSVKDVIILTSGASSPKLPAQYPGKLFLACFGDNTQAAAAAEYPYKILGARTAYILYDKNMEYTTLLSRYFKERFIELGGSVSTDDFFEGGASDYSSFTANYKALNPEPDMLFIAAGPEDCGSAVKAFREAGINKPIFGGDSFDTPSLFEKAGNSAVNVYYTTHAYIDANSVKPRVLDFIEMYVKEYSKSDYNAFTALGYDAVMIFAKVINDASSFDCDSLDTAFFAIKDFPAVTGSLSYGTDTYIPRKYVTLMKADGIKAYYVNEILPEKIPEP